MKKLFFIPLLFLTACSTTRTPKLTLQPQEPSPATDDSSIRYAEVIRAYHVGRYADPDDDLVMHEQHVIYRVEENTRWNLHPGPVNDDIVLTPPASRDAAFNPPPVNDEVLAEVNAQKLATIQIILEARTLSAALAQFQAALQQTKTNLQETAVLRVAVIEMKKRLDALETAQRQPPPVPDIPTNEPSDSSSP
jgi:uncharacterized lipoprotein YmbA